MGIIVVSAGLADEVDTVMNENCDSRIKYMSYRPAMGENYTRKIGIKTAWEWLYNVYDGLRRTYEIKS